MARKSKEFLEQLKKDNNVDELWSWSKFNKYKTCSYEFFLKYILKIPEDRVDGIYGQSGGAVHEILESFYKNEITYEQMLEKYEDSLMIFNFEGLKYNRSDEDKNTTIADKYEKCIKHFLINHQPIKSKVILEKFVTASIGDNIFQSYIDFMHQEGEKNNKKLIITDWKTSTIYTGKKLDAEKWQLVLYAEGVRQAINIPIENIVIRWGFLKYVTVDEPMVNGKVKARNIERNQIGAKLASKAEMWLKKKGYSEFETSNYIADLVTSNDINVLPDDIKSMYKVYDCYVNIPLNEDVINELKQDIIETIKEIKEKTSEYKKNEDDKIWWKEVTDKESWYFANLCGYSAALHKPYSEYLDKLNMFKDKDESTESDNELLWLDEL